MKKLSALLMLAALAAGITAQEEENAAKFTIGGEVKTGLLWTQTDTQLNRGEKEYAGRTTAGNKDDAGSGAGRFRINMEYAIGHVGIKARLQTENWANSTGLNTLILPYAFGYVNFMEDQFTLSMGKLGASPWGTGGPELWKEVESIDSLGGMRLEWKPAIAENYGKFNIGFVINAFDGFTDMYPAGDPITFLDVLQESVLGVSYTHEKFHARFAYRFDSEADKDRDSASALEGGRIVYRVEEYALRDVIPDFSIWALGYWYGVGAPEVNKDIYNVQNWLFFQWAPSFLTAQIRVGYDVLAKNQVVHVRPGLYGHFFGRLLTVGALFSYAQDFGDFQVHEGSPFSYIILEPLAQFNMTPNSYFAVAYNWERRYVHETPDHIAQGLEPLRQTQWVNIRVGMTF